MNSLVTFLSVSGAVRREERQIVGVLGGAMYVVGGLILTAFSVLPGVSHAHVEALLILAAVACVWGLIAILLIDWERAPGWAVLPITVGGLLIIGLGLASSGGGESPAWIYLFLAVVFAAYFYPPRTAYAFMIGCVLTHASVLIYDSRALHNDFLAQFAVAGPAYLLMGGAIVAGRRRMWELRRRAERLAAEQSALRRVATAVVGGESADGIYERVAIEVAELVGADASGILKFEGPEQAVVTGSWAAVAGGRYEPGTVVAVRPDSDIAAALRDGRSVGIGDHPDESPTRRLGYRSSVVTPIRVSGATWGLLAVAASDAHAFSVLDEQHLTEFGDLLATAIASIEDRAKLAAQALSDPLTGLANHRSLQQRLGVEVSRAARHGTPLSVVVLDIDHFKSVNDTAGHETGDEVLACVAECLTELARAEDTLGRIGGDEFAWVLPETTREQALIAVERARTMVASTLRRPYGVTVSAGICDTSVSDDAAELINLADGALYWSKAHGRNQSWIYDPKVIDELSAQERAEHLERSQALLGLRALARAIDAKDPATRKHSERVSELAAKLALKVGWLPERAQLLGEAARLHDVGKIGVPDGVLTKSGPLTADERKQIEGHAELSARIVEDVLTPEQVEWIRTQHERPDGLGYPTGLRGHEIPEGAALLALADSWDVMTASRSYSLPKAPDDALTECIGLVGRQFTKTAVMALLQLHSAGELVAEEALVGR